MMRNILSVLGGFIVGILVIALIHFIDYKIYESDLEKALQAAHEKASPETPYQSHKLADYSIKEKRDFMEAIPFAGLLLMCFSIFAGSIVSGFIASQLHFESGKTTSIIAGILILISAVVFMTFMPHKPWFWLVCGVTIVPLAYLGYFIDSSYLGRDEELEDS